MKITKQARQAAKQLLRDSIVNGVLDENRVRETVRRTIAQKPRGYLAVLTHFERLIKLETDRRTARIESATPLSAEQRTAVENNLTRQYGRGLHISFAENPALLGGLRIKVGSDVYDGTVRSRLNNLQERF